MSDKIYRVYRHITPDGMIYVGVTSQDLKQRWQPSRYRRTSLQPQIEKYGWDNIKHEVIYTCEDKNEAYGVENEMVIYWGEKGVVINKNRSGLICASDIKGYNKDWENEHREDRKLQKKIWYEEHAEYRKEQMRVYNKSHRSTPEGKIYDRVHAYNRCHPDNITITALEARYNYTTYSIVPDFIKHDDIPNAIVYNPSVSTDQVPLF